MAEKNDLLDKDLDYESDSEDSERDLSAIYDYLKSKKTESPEEEEQRMIKEGWVTSSQTRSGPPQRPVPMPPRSYIPSIYSSKFDYDTRHFYENLLADIPADPDTGNCVPGSSTDSEKGRNNIR